MPEQPADGEINDDRDRSYLPPDTDAAEPATSANAVTSVHFPSPEPSAPQALSAEETAAVEALPAGSALLIDHTGVDNGARFLLDGPVVTAGRHPEADIFLDDVTVSRRHARFCRESGGYRVEDTGSLNGTYVNGDRVDSVKLQSGGEVQIGKFRLTYYSSTSA